MRAPELVESEGGGVNLRFPHVIAAGVGAVVVLAFIPLARHQQHSSLSIGELQTRTNEWT